MIVVIDYNVGNVKSVCNALTHIGCGVKLSWKLSDIEQADGIILPGVAAFGFAVGELGFGYDPTGDANGSTSWRDYVHPQNSDPFTANVFRTIMLEAPVADAGEDIIANANEQVVLDANGSYDPDGEIAEYTWTALPEEEVLYSGPNSVFIERFWRDSHEFKKA